MKKKTMIFLIIVVAAVLVTAFVGAAVYMLRFARAAVDVECGSAQWNRAKITWSTKGFASGEVLVYSDHEPSDDEIAECIRDGGSDSLTLVDGKECDGAGTSLTKLLPDTDYYAVVAPYRSIFGKKVYLRYSETLRFTTAELTVPAPTIEKAAAEGDSAAMIMWSCEPMTEKNSDGSDIEFAYEVTVYENGEIKTNAENVSGAETYEIKDLVPLAEYSFEVCTAAKADGREYRSDMSEKKSVRTNPSPVTGLSADESDTSSITVKWNACGDTLPEGAGAAYTLYCSDKADGEYKAIAENITETQYVHKGLSEDTEEFYKVSVCVTVGEDKYTSAQSEAVSGRTKKAPKPAAVPAPTNGSNSGSGDKGTWSNNSGSAGGSGAGNTKYDEALAVAKRLAAGITGSTDIEKVQAAAQIVAQYCLQCTYTMEGADYATAYGVFVKGEYSCAGATRALGMLLGCMGYKWAHVNENLYTHQWVQLTMDGQLGWADGQIGYVGYGEFPFCEVETVTQK